MNQEVKNALSGIKSAWKNLICATDKETYDAWFAERVKLDYILHREMLETKGRIATGVASTHTKAGPGRPRKYITNAEREIQRRKYQHEYYLKVTRVKRAERRKNEVTK